MLILDRGGRLILLPFFAATGNLQANFRKTTCATHLSLPILHRLTEHYFRYAPWYSYRGFT